MLRFEPRFCVDVLRMELGIVLHHASHWSILSRLDVVVDAGANGAGAASSADGWVIDLHPDGDGVSIINAASLARYLARVVPSGCHVFHIETRVQVDWDPRRRPAVVEGDLPSSAPTSP